MSVMERSSQLSLGYALMLGAFFCFASMDTSAKWLVGAAVPALQVAFVRYLVHFGWTIALYLPREGLAITVSNKPLLQILRALFLLIATALNFTALQYLPLTITVAIFFAAPLVVCLLSIPILGEKVGLRRFAAVLVGFVGVLVIVQPWGESFNVHILLPLGATLCASGYFVMTRLIAGVDGNSVAQFYSSGIAALLLCPFAIGLWVWPTNATDWIVMLSLGSFGMLGHTLLTRAHHYAEASVLAPAVYSQILYISLFSWILFDSPPDAKTIFGTLIIVASGLYIWLRERRAQQAIV